MNKQPEVTTKTRQNLIDSFWNLYIEKPIDKITIGAIAKNAGYNRSTFYAYFTDIYDLLDQMENEMIETLSAKFKTCWQDELPMDFQIFSARCAEIFAENGDKLFYLLNSSANNKFAAKMKKALLPIVVSRTGFSGPDKNLEYIQAFIFSAMLGMIGHWYDSGKEMDVTEFVKMAQTLVANGVLGYTQISLFK